MQHIIDELEIEADRLIRRGQNLRAAALLLKEADGAALKAESEPIVPPSQPTAEPATPVQPPAPEPPPTSPAPAPEPPAEPETSDKMKASWTPERRAAMAERIRARNLAKGEKNRQEKEQAEKEQQASGESEDEGEPEQPAPPQRTLVTCPYPDCGITFMPGVDDPQWCPKCMRSLKSKGVKRGTSKPCGGRTLTINPQSAATRRRQAAMNGTPLPANGHVVRHEELMPDQRGSQPERKYSEGELALAKQFGRAPRPGF